MKNYKRKQFSALIPYEICMIERNDFINQKLITTSYLYSCEKKNLEPDKLTEKQKKRSYSNYTKTCV